MIKLYQIICEAQVTYSGKPSFRLDVTEIEAIETSQTYKWDGRRIAKRVINKPESISHSYGAVSYKVYSLEGELEENKQKVIESVKEQVELKLKKAQELYSIIQEKPTEKFIRRVDDII